MYHQKRSRVNQNYIMMVLSYVKHIQIMGTYIDVQYKESALSIMIVLLDL
jgi:hypothetical protein